MAKLGWKPRRKPSSQWLADVTSTVFRNRHNVNYKPGAEKRVIESALDWYWLGRFTSDKKFIDWLEAEIKREEV